jgi:hypothetical protein
MKQSLKKRPRRFSVVVNTVDGYTELEALKETRSILLHGKVRKEITTKDQIFDIPQANKHSEAEWLRDAECESTRRTIAR